FWPAATQPLPRLSVISVFLASLAGVNYRGVAAGTLVSNASVVAKLAALGMVCVAGVLYLSLHPRVAAAPVAASVDGWLQAMLLGGFSQFASFSWNVTLSAVARLFFYAAVCVAVPVLRRRQAAAALWRLPGGPILPLLGVIICAVLLTRVDFSKSLILLATIGAACANWLMVRRSAVQAASGG